MKKINLFISTIIICLFTLQASASGITKKGFKPSPCSPPVVTITPDTTVCKGSLVTLTATGGGSYLWDATATTSSITVRPFLTTTYVVRVTVDTCSTYATTKVTVIPGPWACGIVPTTATICPGSGGVSLSLNCSEPDSYTWSPSVNLTCTTCSNPVATPTATTTYKLIITDNSTGCTVDDSITVNISNTLTAMISGADTICKGSPTMLTASGGSTYLWSNGATTNVITIFPTVTTTYTVKVASGSCSDSTIFKLNVDSCGPSGINPIVQNESFISLFPNPNRGSFTLSLSNTSEKCTIEIYNVLGQEVKSEELKAKNETINLTGQPSGVYFYRVLKEDGSLVGTGKVVIEK
jgi:hypothetical protein